MTTNNDENQFKQFLQVIIQMINETINKLQPFESNTSDNSPIGSSSNYYYNTFTLNREEDEEIDRLKINIEKILHDQLLNLSEICRKYLLNILYQYQYNEAKREFENSLNLSTLLLFNRDLQSIRNSIDSFQAAWNGDLLLVKEFIKNYPALKDKPGLWGTTLLYSAARNNHQKIVEYLIETAKCSVDAQNEQDLEKILLTTGNFEINSKAASTALHGACFNGHLTIVKYLIEHEANYFLNNQAKETPIMNGESREHIRNFFTEFLILGYSNNLNILPDKPILEETKQIIDCIWEYKPFNDDRWFVFSIYESNELQKSLIITSDEKFQSEIRLKVSQGIYSVSTIQFLRSGKNEDKENNLAWIRCRGSSILNFDCYSLWQIMFLTHPKVKSKSSPSLQIFQIPTIYDHTFEIQLNSWYTCDENTNFQLDHAMNYRRKLIHFKLDFISNEQITFNLQTFSFENNDKTIIGFLRWIPKIISNSEQDKNKIKSIDNFSTLTNLNPIPLTTKHLREITQTTESTLLADEEILEDQSTSVRLSKDIKDDEEDPEHSKKVNHHFFSLLAKVTRQHE